MCTTIVYQRIADFLVCSVRQKLVNCTFISNSRVKTSKLTPYKHIFLIDRQDLQDFFWFVYLFFSFFHFFEKNKFLNFFLRYQWAAKIADILIISKKVKK
jgi:hypothetical protein